MFCKHFLFWKINPLWPNYKATEWQEMEKPIFLSVQIMNLLLTAFMIDVREVMSKCIA